METKRPRVYKEIVKVDSLKRLFNIQLYFKFRYFIKQMFNMYDR